MFEFREFLEACPPFDQLPAQELSAVADRVHAETCAEGATVFDPTHPPTDLFIIRRGAIDLRMADDATVLARMGAGDCIGQRQLLGVESTPLDAIAVESTDVFRLPGEDFRRLHQEHEAFRTFFDTGAEHALTVDRMRVATSGADTGINLLAVPLSDLMTKTVTHIPPDTSIRQCAALMAEQHISSMLIVANDRLLGIVTDRDLRNRVVAVALSPNAPVSEIMSPKPIRIDIDAYGFEALMHMAKHRVHHLPVFDEGRIVGMITSTDLLERRATSAVHLVSEVYRAGSVDDLAKISAKLDSVLVSLVDASASAHSIGHMISSVGEAINIRLLQLAEAKFGPPPVDYAWMSGGSLARNEQTALSDQDNFMVLSDDYDEREHGAYFERLARFVCDALNVCGYVYCPGEVMAITPQWRQPLAVWKRYFDRWIDEPEPKALMLSCIFFDMRLLYGSASLFESLQTYTLEKSKTNRIYLAFMTSNAMTHQPPLGFFRNFALIRGGEHHQTLDLKHNGVIPIVDLARIYCLAAGLAPVNTQARLAEAGNRGELSARGGADLRDALEFIGTVRLEHQARRIKAGLAADNFVPPASLSHFDRNHLKDAFALVRTMQSALAQRYQAGRMG